ncbi:MAG: hypothetical protein IJS15_07515 [Victivallales bacterium]|nr:hypothetical protein [Victivallales bacterium]
MNVTQIPFECLSPLDGMQERNIVNLKEVQKAADVIYATSCFEPTKERMDALNIMKAALDRIEPDTYKTFYNRGRNIPAKELDSIHKQLPALWWYDDSFRKILHELLFTPVDEGDVILWHIYNMGYLIKTHSHSFAIDPHHRLAEDLIQYIKFAGVTHNHGDHYTIPFAFGMNGGHKLFITNFFPNDGYPGFYENAGYSKGPKRTLKVDDITINTFETDHNNTLSRFVQPIEIHCGEGDKACVILTSGDTNNAKQLQDCAKKPDFYIVHPYVGLDVAEAARILQPKMTLVSHLQELHHPLGGARWTWRQGYDAAKKIWEAGYDAVVPAWGEKIVWKHK